MSKRLPVQFADSPELARRFLDELVRSSKGREVAIDTEFTMSTNEIALMSYSWGKNVRRVVEGGLVKEFFGDWLQSSSTRGVYQNFKADKETFDWIGINVVPSFYADVMVTGCLRDETLLSHDLKSQGEKFLDWKRKGYKQLFCYVPEGKRKPIVMDPKQVLYDLPADALKYAVVDVKGKTVVTEPRTRAQWRQLMLDYSGDDAEETILLHYDHKRRLKKMGYWEEYKRVDRPFTLTLMGCEEHGVFIDQARLQYILRKQEARIMRAEHCFRAVAGDPKLNLRSTPQMKALLFDKWDWPTREDLVTDSGEPSLDKESLNWYVDEHGFDMATVKLEFNNASTLKGTFLTGLLTGVSDDGRLRSDLNQLGAKATGRISSRKFEKQVEETRVMKRTGEVRVTKKTKKVGANLQNIPSRKEKDPDGIRGAFRAPRIGEITAWGDIAEAEHELRVADYSGFELCMAIHWASTYVKDSPMLAIMQKYGSPSACHAFTAINLYADRKHTCDLDCVDKKALQPGVEMRPDAGEAALRALPYKRGHAFGQAVRLGKIKMDDWKLVKSLFPDEYGISKNNNFNLLYGGSAKMMARLRGLDYRDDDVLAECQQQADDWNELYWEIPIYQQRMVDHGYEHGWVPTLGGRRINVKARLEGRDSHSGRLIPDEQKRKQMIAYGERCCMNGPCQGSAADIVKVAMNLIRESKMLRELRAALLFPVHDEVIMEGPTRYGAESLAEQVRLMKLPYAEKLAFHIDVEGMRGENWLAAKG